MTQTIRERVLATSTRKTETITIPEWDTDIVVQELDGQQRTEFYASMDVNPGASTAKVDLSVLLPYVTQLILDPETRTPMFELGDRQTLVVEHPGVIERVLFTAFELSDLGEHAVQAAEGNSAATPS